MCLTEYYWILLVRGISSCQSLVSIFQMPRVFSPDEKHDATKSKLNSLGTWDWPTMDHFIWCVINVLSPCNTEKLSSLSQSKN